MHGQAAKAAGMEDDHYDEFGNYIGPALDSDEDDDDEVLQLFGAIAYRSLIYALAERCP